MTNQQKINSKEQTLIRQARRIAVMRRKNALWKDLEPALNRMGGTVRAIERLEALDSAEPKAKRASA